MLKFVSAVALGFALAAPAAHATTPADGVLGRFVGDWTVSGQTRGHATATGAEVRAQFGGAFVELHIQDPTGRSPYEARVWFGQDGAGKLVIHWLDATGGETSRTMGTGDIKGDSLMFAFPYPDGTFRDRLEYDRAHDQWRLRIETGDKAPVVFSDWLFTRRAGR